MGSKTLPSIWGTDMKLVTKYQISAINSWYERFKLIIPPLAEGGGGILFYLCPSFRPSKIFSVTFFSVTVDGRI
jgi:hypothetical protein